jgi:hypothetical protein
VKVLLGYRYVRIDRWDVSKKVKAFYGLVMMVAQDTPLFSFSYFKYAQEKTVDGYLAISQDAMFFSPSVLSVSWPCKTHAGFSF